MKYVKKSNLNLEMVDDSCLVTENDFNEPRGIYLFGTAVDILELCDGEKTLDDIISIIINKYDVDYSTCSKDVKSCIGQLEELGLICKQ